jgi:hypothetical protein
MSIRRMAETKTNNTNTARVELVLTMAMKNGGHLGLHVSTMAERDGSKLSARRRNYRHGPLSIKLSW